MNGSRSTFMRKGYLLTALAAAVLLAASSGTAYAQRVSIGFVDTSGQVSEKAFLNVNSLEDPQTFMVSVSGLLPGARREGDVTRSLGNVTITPSKAVWIARVTSSGAYMNGAAAPGAAVDAVTEAAAAFTIDMSHFSHSDEVMLVVAQSADGSGDTNWVDEKVELHLEVQDATTVSSPASVNPDIYTLTVMESHVAPVAKFGQPDFTLAEQSMRTVSLDVASGIRGVPLPGGALDEDRGVISVRVSNHNLVTFDAACPARTDPSYNRKLFRITVGDDWSAASGGSFTSTALLQTTDDSDIGALAVAGAGTTADFDIEGCGDGAGIRDPYITLTILESNLAAGPRPTYRAIGDIETGPPLMISIDSDEAVPTLSFSPTNVEIDEGGSTSTVLLAEGSNADDVGMVKLSVEGDAMVSLMQDGEMLEEMGGYVYVDLDGNTSARLEAMSHSDPDLMDGDMASKTWKLMEGGTDGANIGEGSWFTVDVRGSTAVPALPLLGQLLLALFLMAGGARLYRRRQG